MKKFILSDLHIGHKNAQYDVMDQAIEYIRQNAQAGEEIWGLGDWFHMYENGFEFCLKHHMTQKFRDLAALVPTKLLPGNHDHVLEKFRDDPSLGNPLSPVSLIKPFMWNQIWYCHGHEFDPSVQYLPRPVWWLWNHLPQRKKTPGNLSIDSISERFMMLVYLVHSRALLNVQTIVKQEHEDCKGVILGHTHLPMHQVSPDLLFLLNDGDMRHSSTFTVEDDLNFYYMTWNSEQKQWKIIKIHRP